MRILFLTHRLPYAPNRGDRVRAYHALHALAARAEVDLVSLVHDAEEEGHARGLLQVAATVTTARVAMLRNAVRALRALAAGEPLTHALLDAPALTSALQRLVATRPPDLVLAYCSGMARLALQPPLLGLPFVLDMVDVDSQKWAAMSVDASAPRRWIYRREARLLGRFEADAVRRARTTLVVNERECETLRHMVPDARVRVVPNGVDVDALRPPGPPAAEPRVVFCGVMNYGPNEEGASWLGRVVWPMVRRSRPDAQLLILGAHPTRRIRSLAAGGRGIEVTGAVSDVRPHLWRSAIAAAPLRTARGVQNKVLEAVAAGLPSVVTPAVFDGLPGEIHPACRTAATAEQFAATLVNLMSRSPIERRRMAAAAELATLRWAGRLAPLHDVLRTALPDSWAPPRRCAAGTAIHAIT